MCSFVTLKIVCVFLKVFQTSIKCSRFNANVMTTIIYSSCTNCASAVIGIATYYLIQFAQYNYQLSIIVPLLAKRKARLCGSLALGHNNELSSYYSPELKI